MSIGNSKLLDADQGLFSTLGLVSFHLPGPLIWMAEDLNESLYRGTIFRGYQNLSEPATQDVRDIAYIFIVDVTEDADEPDVSKIDDSDLPEIDALIHENSLRETIASGMQMVQWLATHINRTSELTALITAYSIRDQGWDRQCIAVRINTKGRKIIAQCTFDLDKRDELATPIFNIIRNITVNN